MGKAGKIFGALALIGGAAAAIFALKKKREREEEYFEEDFDFEECDCCECGDDCCCEDDCDCCCEEAAVEVTDDVEADLDKIEDVLEEKSDF